MIYWFGGSLDVAAVLDFVDSCKDLIVAADASASDLIRSIALEFGVDFDEARNNARTVFSGSLDLFSNKYAIFCNCADLFCHRIYFFS
ncbi:putative dolichyl-diphosphooligosaccharide--protein glycotransferase [Helianthus anomalus]